MSHEYASPLIDREKVAAEDARVKAKVLEEYAKYKEEAMRAQVAYRLIEAQKQLAAEKPNPEPKPVVLEETIAQIRLLLTNHEGQTGREIILTDPEAAALLEEIDSLRDQIEAARYYAALTETP